MTCAHCKKPAIVLIAMKIGKDSEWQLCTKCWRECLDREPLGNIPKRYREDGFVEEPR